MELSSDVARIHNQGESGGLKKSQEGPVLACIKFVYGDPPKGLADFWIQVI
jgi:hypothetical protein